MPRFWNCLVWANVRSRQIDANRVLLFVLVCRLSHQVSWPICPGPQKPKIESATWRPRAMYNSRCQGHRGVALLCTTGQCRFEMIRIERNRFNECRQRFRSMLVCKVLARIQDHLQNAEQALYRLRANSIVQICAVCIFTISIHLLILLAFPGIRWKATCYYSSRDERGEDKCDWCELLAASAQKHVLMTLPIFDNLGRFIKPALPLLFWILCKSWADQLEAWRTFGCQYPPPAWWTTPGLNLKWHEVTEGDPVSWVQHFCKHCYAIHGVGMFGRSRFQSHLEYPVLMALGSLVLLTLLLGCLAVEAGDAWPAPFIQLCQLCYVWQFFDYRWFNGWNERWKISKE